jgi:hypothetical protein
VSDSTQVLFNNGHRFEALARPIGEQIIGEDLYPVVGSNGKLSASFDGITLDESIIFEHKSLNEEIRHAQTADDLGLHLRVQMEQQLLVSGAEKCLFMASRWDGNDELIEEVHFWYEPDLALREQIVAGWEQFNIDLAEYVPVEVLPDAVAAPTLDLPAVAVRVDGQISLVSNLDVFGVALRGFIERIPTAPATDQEFADCKDACKKLQTAQDALDAAEANAMGQIASFDEMKRAKTLLWDLTRTTRLALEKLVTAQESKIKADKVQGGKDKLAEHIAALNKRLGKPYMPPIVADWAAAIKSLRTMTSLQNAIDTLLAAKKIEASAAADRIELNLNSLRELASDYAFLFSDTPAIISKANDDLVALIKSRIADHAAAEAKKAEELRAKIAEEERIKAEAKAKADADAKAKADADAEAEAQAVSVMDVTAQSAGAECAGMVPGRAPQALPFPTTTPIIDTVTQAVAPAAVREALAPSGPPTLTLGKIGTRLGFSLTADFLRGLGFEPVRERSAVLFHESDWQAICAALVSHIEHARMQQQVA